MKITENQQEVLDAQGHCLVLGGPGSGKTTISILKAAAFVEEHLKTEQTVLFLSFARATVARVSEGIRNELKIPRGISHRIEVDTYHSFFWKILKGHGYLVGMPRDLDILLPADVAAALHELRAETDQTRDDGLLELTNAEKEVLFELARNEGKIAFDLFSPILADLLQRYPRIAELIAKRHPVIILDEFQDTSDEQWEIVKQLGKRSTCIALADPEQRIFDFIATDPERPRHFRQEFQAPQIDLGGYSHRNRDTDISLFGDDILRGEFSQLAYVGIDVIAYPRLPAKAQVKLFSTVLAAKKRASEKSGDDWAVAVLVPTRAMTKRLSDLFNEGLGKLPPISHSAVVERDAAILSAHCIGFMLQKIPAAEGFETFVGLVSHFFRGRSGDRPAQGHLKTANKLISDLKHRTELLAVGGDLPKASIVWKMEQVYREASKVQLNGDPQQDWVSIRGVFEQGVCAQLKDISKEARNLRFLDRGTQMRLGLTEDWDGAAKYPNALTVTKEAFV